MNVSQLLSTAKLSSRSMSFFFRGTPSGETYTLSLHDALPISLEIGMDRAVLAFTAGLALFTGLAMGFVPALQAANPEDRKSTRLNSSHRTISYAVFCLKKKKYDR